MADMDDLQALIAAYCDLLDFYVKVRKLFTQKEGKLSCTWTNFLIVENIRLHLAYLSPPYVTSRLVPGYITLSPSFSIARSGFTFATYITDL